MQKLYFLTIILLFSQTLSAQYNVRLFDSTWTGFTTGDYSNSRYPFAGRLADIDNDGDLDVAVTYLSWSSHVAVFKNFGNGFYGDPVHYQTAEVGLDLEFADVDNDGDLDLISLNTHDLYFGDKMEILYNDGNGNYSNAVTVYTGDSPTGITKADFNMDGLIDLAVTNFGDYLGNGDSIAVLLNNGNGTFARTAYFSDEGPFRITAGYLNSDSLPDLVVANEHHKINVLINIGNGFTTTTYNTNTISMQTDVYPCVQLIDMDNDGDTDVLYGSTGTITQFNALIIYFENLGNGTFNSPIPIPLNQFSLSGGGSGVTDMAIADFDNDGNMDIVAAPMAEFQVILNDGSFTTHDICAGGNTLGVMAGDVDSDGLTDVVTIDYHALQITVHKNYGNANFYQPPLYDTNPFSTYLDAADYDNDGDQDLLTSSNQYTTVSVTGAYLKNNGDATFAPFVSLNNDALGAKFAYIDGDSLLDIVYASGRGDPPYDFHYMINNGNGGFGPEVTVPISACGWSDIEPADVDNDGDTDILISEWLGCTNVPSSNKRIFVALNDGSGNFISLSYFVTDPFPAPMGVGDWNLDGNIDVVSGHPDSLSVHFGNGDGTFQPDISYFIEENATDIRAYDVNHDGLPDIVSSNTGVHERMSILINNGNNTFQQSQNYYVPLSQNSTNAMGITAGDVNGDGYLDVIVGNYDGNGITIFINDGLGNFTMYPRYGVFWKTTFPVFGNFDGDSLSEIAAVVRDPTALFLSAHVTVIHGVFAPGSSSCSFNVSTTVTDVSCNGASDGEISVSVTGGNSPYSFSWNTGDTLPNITGLAAGNYTLTITDDSSCVETTSITITQPQTLTTIANSTTSASTTNCTGTASVVTNGGTPPFTYSWSNGDTTNTISNVCPGMYYITITDDNLCVTNDSVEVELIIDIAENNINDIKVYPNPTTGEFTVELPENHNARELKLVNLLGQKILNINENDLEIINNFKINDAGSYYLIINGNTGITAIKILVLNY